MALSSAQFRRGARLLLGGWGALCPDSPAPLELRTLCTPFGSEDILVMEAVPAQVLQVIDCAFSFVCSHPRGSAPLAFNPPILC